VIESPPLIQPAARPAHGLAARLRLAAVALAAVSLLGAFVVHDSPLPSYVVYLASLALGLGAIWLVARAERSFLINLFLGAFCLRVVLVVASHLLLVRLGTSGFAFADDHAYDKLGWDIARAWHGEIPGILQADSYLLMNYTYLLGFVYFNLGHSVLAAKVMDALFGAATALGVYGMARALWDVRAARAAGVVAALFPSMLIWSLLNLKDALVVLLIAFVLFGALRFARQGDWRGALLAVAVLAPIENMRFYVFLILGWVLPLFYFVASSESWRLRLRKGVPFAIAVFATVYLLGSNTLGLEFLNPREVKNLEGIRGSDNGEVRTRLNVTKIDDDNVYRRQLIYLPEGVLSVLTAPLPWDIATPAEAAIQPDLAAWYVVLVGSALGVLRGLRTRRWAVLLPAAYVGGMILALALIENNVGTLVRHRAMILPPMIGLAGPTLWFIWTAAFELVRARLPFRLAQQAPA